MDALCINQDDNAEKCHQVRLMRDIYAKAKETMAWLGDDPESPHIMWPSDQPREVSSAILANHDVVGRAFHLLRQSASGPHYFLPADDTIGGSSIEHEHLIIKALGCFIRFLWWSRLWTAQEAVIPQYVVMVCGYFRISWVRG